MRFRSPRARVVMTLAAAGMVAGSALATTTPASAVTSFDGVWTISHGATGQIVFNGDYTYTSTCTPIANFPATNCPAPSGTFSLPFSSAYMSLTGSDGRTMSFRKSGPAGAPTSISGGGGAGTYSGIIVDKGSTYHCSTFYDSTYAFARGPLVYTNSKGKGFVRGSNQSVGSINAGNYVFISEPSPGYFVKGSC
ncbi:MAG: hypothetical protein AB7L13_15290 [Acidimicrobiia bacterium]